MPEKQMLTKASWIALAVYGGVVLMTAVEAVVMDPSDAMGYTLVFLYFLLPTASFACSFAIALQREQHTAIKFVAAAVFSLVGFAMPFVPFGYTEPFAAWFGLVPACFGLIPGLFIATRRNDTTWQRR